MKIIHTADWHLGQTFFDYDRTPEHVAFLEWLKGIIIEQKADLLLVSGDVFDNSNPSARAQNLYYTFLWEISRCAPGLQVIIVAGNHDSAARLEAPAPLLEGLNITVRGIVRRDPSGEIDLGYLAVPVKVNGEPAAVCLAVPYLRQGDYPDAGSYSLGVEALYKQLHGFVKDSDSYKDLPIIAMGHLQATGSRLSENDRWERSVIGGLEAVSPDSFHQEFLYTALGHLHKAQRVSGRENVRYSGSPLPMSFSEKNYKQGVTIIDPDGISQLVFDPPARLVTIPSAPAAIEEVLYQLAQLPEGEATVQSPYIEIKVLVDGPEPSLRHKIERALNGKSVKLTRIEAVLKEKGPGTKMISSSEVKELNPLEVANGYFVAKYGGEGMPETMQRLFSEALEKAQKEVQR